MILAYTLSRRCQLYGTNRLFPLKKIVRSKEEIAKMREHSMRLSDFHIGLEFWMSDSQWRCTDVGSRVVVAIKLDCEDEKWYKGPPYGVAEFTLDEDEIPACSLTPNGGNSGQDDEEEGNEDVPQTFEERRATWIANTPIREKHEAAEWAALTAHRAKRRLPPMTQAQLDAEAAYAKKIYEEYQDPNSDFHRRVEEALKRRRPKLN